MPLIPLEEMTVASLAEISDSQSLDEQVEMEQACFQCLRQHKEGQLFLLREEHADYLTRRLNSLPASFSGLDASQAWLAYWAVHALYLLGVDLDEDVGSRLARVLLTFQNLGGGFGGGPRQMSHLAVTYATVNCLCILRRLEAVDRSALAAWMLKLKQPDGSFRLQLDGEVDVRGVYCAVATAKLLELEEAAELFSGTAEWIARCQTYEGGFGGAPGSEAHGGYSYCAFAALLLLGRSDLCDLRRLLRWAANRQMRFEGGFQGRTNKLVDSCYSFWAGALFPLVQRALLLSGGSGMDPGAGWLFNQLQLQRYVLGCCQKRSGGLYDKPPGSPDPYHCCYSLSGLAVAQHCGLSRRLRSQSLLHGQRYNLLRETCPLHNVGIQLLPAGQDSTDSSLET